MVDVVGYVVAYRAMASAGGWLVQRRQLDDGRMAALPR
jgi:hypothetical protein